MKDCLVAHGISTQRVVDRGNWRMVLLDSTIPGEEGGRLAESELRLVEDALDDTDKHVLLCLHHQPVPVGSKWLDTMELQNREEFFRMIRRDGKTRAVIWGHVHQSYHETKDDIELFATPSTCVQFAPGTTEFKVDDTPPGCRLLALGHDGKVASCVLTIDAVPVGADMDSAGY